MRSSQEVLAICVNWNGGEVLNQTVRSLLSSGYPDLQVVVVDNHSSLFDAGELPPEVEVIRLAENLGYGGAINAVLEERLGEGARAPFGILILNNDLLVAPGAVGEMARILETEKAGIVGPRIVQAEAPERLEAAWGKISWSHVLVRLEGKDAEKTEPKWQLQQEVEMLLGSFLLIRPKVFQQVGCFDTRFFMYHEEVDFQYRARKEGFSLLYCPSAEVRHLGGYSTRGRPDLKTYWLRRNTLLFLRKHRAAPLYWIRFWISLFMSLGFNLLSLKMGKVRAILRGVSEGLSARIHHE